MSRSGSGRAMVMVMAMAMVTTLALLVTSSCGVDDDRSEALQAVEAATRARDDLRASGVVEVLDDVSVVVPPPGMRVTVEVVYDDGQMELVDVWNDEDGRVELRYPDEDWGLVAPPPPAAVCPSECTDDRMSLLGAHWTGALSWYYRDAGRPAALGKATSIKALRDGALAPPAARDGCGLADDVSASQAYLGETLVAPNISLAGGMISCTSADAQNVVGWADLPGTILAVTCLWWGNDGVASSTDMLYDDVYGWYTGKNAPAGCTNQFSLRSVATHEFGHAFGLGHSPGNSCNLTMYPAIGACSDDERSFGLGDVLGLEAMY